ncbi:MAG: YerC/YecD family TrpR-related protein [Pseudomonadota bacterium]|jgi:TrpR-related protein YerC/YecD|nr:YerC/YecD family TrpR-related protein [Alphaproteobacteria bacterium]MEC7703196.1 YerC/YecD family TrpR-related protein [Pseudomonadota bacterium]MED5423163.1 YerC/YecD family TrpR-related protein [Pseudomonadota bacterium]MEE3323325.1 YerC/YecD family TrpR-related protein [Pseudomonadota bacterium]
MIDLYQAILSLGSEEECAAFMEDLCTPAELTAMRERWLIANLLYEGRLSYREISAQTGASTTTIGRVARFLQQENNKGYLRIIERLNQNA